MSKKEIKTIVENSKTLKRIKDREEILWINKNKKNIQDFNIEGLSIRDIDDAEERLIRFAPFIMEVFPETNINNGLIESPLKEISKMKNLLINKLDKNFEGSLYIKMDSHLPIAGSVKARGGIYEILKHTEKLALDNGIIKKDENYIKLKEENNRDFFSRY